MSKPIDEPPLNEGGAAGTDAGALMITGTAGDATAFLPAQRKGKSGKVVAQHGVRTTRYYSLSDDDLANLGTLQGIATVCFSFGTGFLFTHIQATPEQVDLHKWSLIATVALYVGGVVAFLWRGTQLRRIKREHDFPEDQLTLLARIGRYMRSWND